MINRPTNPYYNPLIELLIENLGISREDLFLKSGIKSKFQFVREINKLLEEDRIIKDYDPLCYAPRIHIIVEQNDQILRKYRMDYLPPKELEKALSFKETGPEPEDRIAFYLEIAGLVLKKEDHPFLQKHCNINFDFDEYCYHLWAAYPAPGKLEEYWKLGEELKVK